MRDGACRDHGPQAGVEDLRLRIILDDGIQNGALILGRDTAEAFLEMDMAAVKETTSPDGGEAFLADLRNRLIGRRHSFTGRAIIDGQGALIMANTFTAAQEDAAEAAEVVRERWGVRE
jgi:ssDNA-binding replication factor A large subunit